MKPRRSSRSGKTRLTPRLEYHESDGVGQIDAAALRAHRDEQGALGPSALECGGRQTAGFGSEQKGVSGLVRHVAVATRAAGLHCEQARAVQLTQAGLEVLVDRHVRQVVIVEPGTLETFIVEPKAQRLYQVQRRAGVRAQANGVAGIRRDFGFEQHDMKHRTYLSSAGRSLSSTTSWVGYAKCTPSRRSSSMIRKFTAC